MSQYFMDLAYDSPPVIGDAAPWFVAPTSFNPRFVSSTLAGRFVLLSFIGAGALEESRTYMKALAGADIDLPLKKLVNFGVTTKKQDWTDPLVQEAFPSRRVFHDPDLEIMKRFGLTKGADEDGSLRFRGRWFLLDPTLRVYESGALAETEKLISTLHNLPDPEMHTGVAGYGFAPILVIPRVLPTEICREFIKAYELGQPQVSGFMRQEGGKTVKKFDDNFKRRQDVNIENTPLRTVLNQAIMRRVAPEIHRCFQFNVTQIERYIVARYDAEEGGFFKGHRDNTTMGTAHRAFAVTINLNAEDYDGGTLRFPEFGQREYKAPTGGAVVFSCSMLHEACPVTKGTRYATLPFLYDDTGRDLRNRNLQFLEGTEAYEKRQRALTEGAAS